MYGKQVCVAKYEDGSYQDAQAFVADEISVRIEVNDLLLATLTCSPWDLEELVVGYLRLTGVIRSYDDVLGMKIEGDIVRVNCRAQAQEAEQGPELQQETEKDLGVQRVEKEPESGSAPAGPMALLASDVTRLMGELERRSDTFHQTGGVHNAALSDGKRIITNTEDVSRHNALNRLVGRCLMRGISLKDRVIVFSGRVPEEIIKIAAQMRCSAIISVSAPTSKAIEIAQEHDVMLISFARGEKFNVYTCRERLPVIPDLPSGKSAIGPSV